MDYIIWIVYLLIALWWISFLYSCYFFFKEDDTESDGIFFNRTRTFEEAHEKLSTLEKVMDKEFKSARKILKKYEENAKKTRRKYSYYKSYIEPSLIKMFVGKGSDLFKRCWQLLDKPIQYHYINIYIFIALFSLFISLLFIVGFGLYSLLALPLLIILILRMYNFIIKINFLFFYILLDGILILFKQDRGKLSKNVALLELMTTGWFGNKRRAYVIGAAGIAAYSGSIGGGYSGDFGGFGGGDFGGGGAGGSW